MKVVTRFAPSPTGFLHIGGARTALFNFLYARRCGGRFLLRVEDTDRRRSTPEAVRAIVDGLAWLGLDGDDDAVFQSERGARYREVTEELLDKKRAYRCWCSADELAAMRAAQKQRGEKPRYDRRCLGRKHPPAGVAPAVRFLNEDDGDVVFTDAVHGEIKISNRELDDLVIARGDGTPTYNFSVVVDDRDMGVTHVIRGDDHINNTPRQINLLRALGAKLPVYAHLPMILGADGARLSKRHGSVSVLEYRRHGCLPQALLNYLARLGWSHGDREIFSMDELCTLFDLAQVNKAAAAFDPEKLRWLNRHYIKETPPESLAPAFEKCLRDAGVAEAELAAGPPPAAVIEAHRERASTLAEMAGNAKFYFAGAGAVPPNLAEKYFTADVTPALAELASAFAATEWNTAAITKAITKTAAAHNLKFGQLAQSVRVAVTGGTVSPPIDATLQLLGRDRVVYLLNMSFLDDLSLREGFIAELRTRLMLSLDQIHKVFDLKFSRSTVYGCLLRLGLNKRVNLKSVRGDDMRCFEETARGFIHIDLKVLGGHRSYAFVAIDRATRYVFVKVVEKNDTDTMGECLRSFLDHFPRHRVHTVLTYNDEAFTDCCAAKKDKPRGEPSGKHPFDVLCREHDIEHRLAHKRQVLRRRKDMDCSQFHSPEERNRFIEWFVDNYNRTPLKCLGDKSPYESI